MMKYRGSDVKTVNLYNMPTPEATGSAASHSEEIKNLAITYSNRAGLPIDFVIDIESVIEKLAEDYCIVPKSKARELRQLVADNADSIDHGLIDGLSDWVEINLGTELFNEEKEMNKLDCRNCEFYMRIVDRHGKTHDSNPMAFYSLGIVNN